ncbi:uncharacterized protein TNCV_572141 [Trichonephila clavipes]|nr:uncharacterized protein TNCV_572141 [Trichonephila clavipes]
MRPSPFDCYKNAGYTTFPHFTSENFAMTVSFKDRALLVNLFHKNNECSPIALQKFRTLKGMKKGIGPMTAQGLEKIIQKFEETGSFHELSGRERKKVNSTVVEEVVAEVREDSSDGLQSCSAWEIARTLDRPVSTVHKILTPTIPNHTKLAKCRSCFLLAYQQMRLCFRISCSQGRGKFVVRRIPFLSDRICQYREFTNMGNTESIRNSTGPYSFEEKGVLGPVTVIVSSQRCECLLRRSSTAWLCGWNHFYARCGSSTHCKSSEAAAEGAFMKCESYQLQFAYSCPPRSPDPWDFWLCGCLKEAAFSSPIAHLAELKHALRNTF